MAIWWQQTPRFLQVPSMRYSLGNNLDAMPLRRPSMLRINRNRPLRSVKPGLSGVSISRSYILISRFETGCYTPTFMKLEKWIVMLLLVLFGLSAASVLWSRVLPRDRTGAAPLWHESAIGVIEINGPIDASRSGVFESGGFQSILEQIHSHRDDDRVKALIIRINSPGGTVGASQEIYQELKRFRSKTHKPIVVSITDLGASGAYWVAMAGDVIVANPGSLVGSVGVIMSGPDFQEVPKRYGVGMRTVKSGKYKDMFNSWRPVTEEERALMQSMLDDVHAQFIEVLITQRGIPTESALQVAQGQVFSGRQAVDLGLVDELGGMSDAIDIAKRKAKLTGEVELIQKSESSMQEILQDYIGAHIRSILPDFRAAAVPSIH